MPHDEQTSTHFASSTDFQACSVREPSISELAGLDMGRPPKDKKDRDERWNRGRDNPRILAASLSMQERDAQTLPAPITTPPTLDPHRPISGTTVKRTCKVQAKNGTWHTVDAISTHRKRQSVGELYLGVTKSFASRLGYKIERLRNGKRLQHAIKTGLIKYRGTISLLFKKANGHQSMEEVGVWDGPHDSFEVMVDESAVEAYTMPKGPSTTDHTANSVLHWPQPPILPSQNPSGSDSEPESEFSNEFSQASTKITATSHHSATHHKGIDFEPANEIAAALINDDLAISIESALVHDNSTRSQDRLLRILKRYAKELQSSAESPIEIVTSNFVRAKYDKITRSIEQEVLRKSKANDGEHSLQLIELDKHLGQQKTKCEDKVSNWKVNLKHQPESAIDTETEIHHTDRDDLDQDSSDGDDDEDDGNLEPVGDEAALPNINEARKFLLRGAPYAHLVESIVERLVPKSSSEAAAESKAEQLIASELRKHDHEWMPVLLPETASLLESRGFLVTERTTAKLSTSILCPEPLENTWVKIPHSLYSVETYQFLGFSLEVAEKLWFKYKTLSHSPYGFLDVAKQHCEDASRHDGESHEDCNLHLCRIGISEELRIAILDKRVEHIRSTNSCDFWLETALTLRWESLHGLNERVLRVLEGSMHPQGSTTARCTKAAPNSAAGTNSSDVALHSIPGEQASSGTDANSATPSQVGSTSDGGKEDSVLDIELISDDLETTVEGIQSVWRGGTLEQLQDIYDTATGTLDVGKMCRAPGDFSGVKAIPYFALDRETAEEYAFFHFLLSIIPAEPAVLEFRVPEKWPGTLNVEYLRYTKDGAPETERWKRVVFHCRRKGYLQKVLESQPEKDVIFGHIAAARNEKFARLQSSDEISADDVLRIPNREKGCIQGALFSDRAQMDFEKICAGRCIIHSLRDRTGDRWVTLELLGSIRQGAGLQEIINVCDGMARPTPFELVGRNAQGSGASLGEAGWTGRTGRTRSREDDEGEADAPNKKKQRHGGRQGSPHRLSRKREDENDEADAQY